MSLRVVSPGFYTSVQDSGRFGFQRFGVPVSGPMDAFAFDAANRLAVNPPGTAAIEFAAAGPELRTEVDCLVALAGVGFALEVDGVAFPAWMAVRAPGGALLRVVAIDGGGWGYLALAGGIHTPPVMGSRATYTRAGFGGLDGRLLQPGDVLPSLPARDAARFAGRMLLPEFRPAYSTAPVVRVVLGPHEEAFTPAGIEAFIGSAYTLTRTADRMGYRLEGAPIQHRAGADILSDGIALGSVQVPGSGQPIVMMSDHQTTGGYTQIGVVARADLPLLAQCQPGVSQVRFRAVTPDEARQAYIMQQAALERGIWQPLEDTAAFAHG